MKDAGCRLGSFCSWGFFDGNIGRQESFLIGAARQRRPTRRDVGSVSGFAPVRGDDGIDLSFITRDFNRGWGKENGTIPI